MFAYKSIECFTSAIKSRHLIVVIFHLNPYMVFQTWNHGEKKRKRKAIILFIAYIADVSCLIGQETDISPLMRSKIAKVKVKGTTIKRTREKNMRLFYSGTAR